MSRGVGKFADAQADVRLLRYKVAFFFGSRMTCGGRVPAVASHERVLQLTLFVGVGRVRVCRSRRR